jgi:hypothetical protein
MNRNIMQSAVQLDEQAKQQLTQEVKETLALNHVNNAAKKKNFTTADMWNRNRRKHPASSQVRRWNLS